MRPELLIKRRQDEWQKMEKILERVGQKREKLDPTTAERLGDLYRGVTSDLALAQREFPNHKITRYLNQLVGRAHSAIYVRRGFSWEGIGHYFRVEVPVTFRKNLHWFWIAFLLFMLPAFGIGFLTGLNPEAARFALPPEVQGLIPIIEDQELWTEMSISERPIFSSGIMTNNIQVSFLAFAGGMSAGVLTTYIMMFNGLLVGGLLGLTTHHGVGFDLLTFMIAHGVVELTVIFIAGAAGLMIGWAMLRPGTLSRSSAVRLAALDAVKLIIICVPLLVIAGLIEGFISPAESIPWPVKFAVGIGTGALLHGYLFLSGREAG